MKYTINDMQKWAKYKKGKCLSEKYLGIETKLKWQCKEGHIWYAVPNSIKSQKSWCPYCSKRIIFKPLIQLQLLAKSKGGKCLSNKYINEKIKLKWRCKEGHEWDARPDNIKHNNRWCPICAIYNRVQNRTGKSKLGTIAKMQNIVKSKEGECLSKQYINNHTSLLWKCKYNHVWKARPNNIISGKWCPQCAFPKRRI